MRRTTPYLFHALLFLAVGVTAGGLTMGVEHRLRASDALPATGALRAAALHRAPHPRRAVEETIPPPLPIGPRYGEEVQAAAVAELTWRLAEGTDGARVELCPTSDFDEGTTRRIDVVGEELKVAPGALPAGIWYWRLRGRQGGVIGDRATPTWMLSVRSPAPAGAGGEGAADDSALTL
jgi:hypothetical protein